MDDFFRKVKKFVEDFKGATEPYEEAMKELFDLTKFFEVPGASKYN